MNIQFASVGDSADLLEIYRKYIDTPITFEYTLPTLEDFSRRIEEALQFYPCLICREENQVLGYAYAHRQAERAAYQWNAELSIYLDPACTSRGLGRRMYAILLELLRLQGIRTAYGCVTLSNEKSTRLHLGMGFSLVGVYHNAGYKCGRWWDVAWYEKSLASYGEAPAPPHSVHTLSPTELSAALGLARGEGAAV